MEKKLNFKVCGLPAKYFIPFFREYPKVCVNLQTDVR